MQQHILKKSHEELERTHRLIESYKDKDFKEIFFSFFGKSFKNILQKYAYKKEEILMMYSSLYSDVSKDILDPSAKAIDIYHVRESITYITQSIEECGNILETLIGYSERQEDIIHHEKLFFVQLLESFNSDLKNWISSHEKEIFGEISKLEQEELQTPLAEGRALLELQKKRLESHIQNIHNT